MFSKSTLLTALPLTTGPVTLRQWTRDDIDTRAAWPCYPSPFTAFNCSWHNLDTRQRDAIFADMSANSSSLYLTADFEDHSCMAYLALHEIDWHTGSSGNLGLRLHPHFCDRGIGTLLMEVLIQWCFSVGFISLRHDVCALNTRAVRCYEKAGYRTTSEFWQDDHYWDGMSVDDPQFMQVRPHVRRNNGVTQVRFYWMEIASCT